MMGQPLKSPASPFPFLDLPIEPQLWLRQNEIQDMIMVSATIVFHVMVYWELRQTVSGTTLVSCSSALIIIT